MFAVNHLSQNRHVLLYQPVVDVQMSRNTSLRG
jgi:hypothetical protein